ncbi:MAG: hypothetical protein ABR999_02590 [Methanoregula sp.]|jgi:hypothetical protein
MNKESKECPKPSSDAPKNIPPIVAKPGGSEKGYTEIIMKAEPKKADSKK